MSNCGANHLGLWNYLCGWNSHSLPLYAPDMHRELWLHFRKGNMILDNVEAVILLCNVVGSLSFMCSKFILPFQKYKHEDGQ